MAMIQIKRHNLKDIVKKHITDVKDYIRLDHFTNYEKNIIENLLEKILGAKPNEFDSIIQLTNCIGSKKIKAAFIGSQVSNWENDGKSYGYGKFSDKNNKDYNAYTLAEALQVNVCPYCNKNYTYTVQSELGKSIRPQFDHFICKKKHPILGLSFYDLIPSCSDCNSSLKLTTHFKLQDYLHPYFDDFNTIKRFSTNQLLSLVNKEEDFSIIFENINNNEYQNLILESKADNIISEFALEEVYNKHKDIVLELIDKYHAYNNSAIEVILKDTKIFSSKADLERLITCGYMIDEDLDKRPLSKMTKDIYEQLKLL